MLKVLRNLKKSFWSVLVIVIYASYIVMHTSYN